MTPRPFRTTAALIVIAVSGALPSLAAAQGGSTPAAPPPGALARWIDLQNATLGFRYRFADTSDGEVTTNQTQHRQLLRGRIKADAAGRYALNFGALSGQRFTGSWNNTGWGGTDAQGAVDLRALFVAAQPLTGVELQVGGLYIVRGVSTEITTYDEDGYVTGARVSIRRPRELYFDEIAVASANLSSVPGDVNVRRRLDDVGNQNYRHYMVQKRLGGRATASADFTKDREARTWRQAVRLQTPELRAIDAVLFEQYARTRPEEDYGFAVSVGGKAITSSVRLDGGYASIDLHDGGLNGDHFHVGNRVFGTLTYTVSPEVALSAFLTRAVGNEGRPLPQRTLSNLIVTYDALPRIKRTGLF